MPIYLKIVSFILKIANSLIPKSKNKILFISRPDFADNVKHMYDYYKSQDSTKKLSWLIYDKYAYDILIKNNVQNIYYLKSLRGVFEYVTTKYVITSSSSLWQIKSPFQKQFGLWHGMPLKTVLCMGEKGIKPERQAGNVNLRFATSNLTKALLAASFDLNAMKIKVTGQPRTDCLLSGKKVLYDFLKIKKNEYSKIVLYMPTYRSGYKNKHEGKEIEGNNVFRFTKYAHDNFLKFLKDHNILFIFKLHPYEEKIYQDSLIGQNILSIKHVDLLKNNLDIHELLNQVDILITDYSSIYFDFLLLDKKIIFIPSDLNIYENNRGFNLEPYDFWTPGKKVYTQPDLESELISTKDEYKHKRKEIKDIIHTNQDANACIRVENEIKKYF